MEVTLEALEAMFERATVTGDIKAIEGHRLYIDLYTNRDHLDITVRDGDTLDTILTIRVPVTVKTSISF